MSLIRDAIAMVREIPGEIARRLNRLALDQHRPTDIEGDQSVAWCTRCNEAWPCDEFIAADARVRDTGDQT